MGNDLWDEFINNLPAELVNAEYCVCGCGVDRMIRNCLNGTGY